MAAMSTRDTALGQSRAPRAPTAQHLGRPTVLWERPMAAMSTRDRTFPIAWVSPMSA